MSPREATAAPVSDAFLFRGIASGDPRAAEELVGRHADRLYGLLRMVLPSATDAEEALIETLEEAAARASESQVHHDPDRWLTDIALDAITARLRSGVPISLDDARRAREGGGAADVERHVDPRVLAGVTDRALGAVVRSLALRPRQALVLRHLVGLGEPETARILGCDQREVERLVRRAFAGIDDVLGEHQAQEDELRRQLADANPYRLRPIEGESASGGTRSDLHTVVQGTRVHLERPPETSLLAAIRSALRAMLARFRQRDLDVNLDDEIGGERAGSPPDPTPTQRPLEKPKRTPSLTDYRSPKLTPGVAVYAMPRSTPTTERLSSPRRPASGQGWGGPPRRGRQN